MFLICLDSRTALGPHTGMAVWKQFICCPGKHLVLSGQIGIWQQQPWVEVETDQHRHPQCWITNSGIFGQYVFSLYYLLSG